jgi:hypothetical protein
MVPVQLPASNKDEECDFQYYSVPFALGKVIDIIYSMDQLKDSSLDQQKQEISKRLRLVCIGAKNGNSSGGGVSTQMAAILAAGED